ncbi:MAG: hypothetical protein IH600_06145 [Bacteroidetes bacterium]|nr:hypothetical protein [Bacteroidota bacterium]
MKQLFAVLLCAFLFVSAASAQNSAYHFVKGKEYKYLIEQTSMQMQEVNGQTSTANSEVTMSVVYTLLETLESGNLKMQATIENALMINESDNGTQTLGSDMSGKSVIFEMTGRGQVVDVDSSIRKIDSEGIGLLIGATSIFPRLDGSKLSDGNSWSSTESDTTGEGESSIIEETERNYEIKGKKSVNGIDCFEIALVSEADREGKMVRGDQELIVNGTRNGKATIMYGIEEGVIVKFDAEINTDQTIVVPSNNMRVPITATQTVKIELITK